MFSSRYKTPEYNHVFKYEHVYEPSEDSFLLLDALEEESELLLSLRLVNFHVSPPCTGPILYPFPPVRRVFWFKLPLNTNSLFDLYLFNLCVSFEVMRFNIFPDPLFVVKLEVVVESSSHFWLQFLEQMYTICM